MERDEEVPGDDVADPGRRRSCPRRDSTSTMSPSEIPSLPASPSEICTKASGAAALSSGDRPVLVRVWKW